MTFAHPAAVAALFQAAAPSGTATWAPYVFQFGLIFLIFYFLIIRPQQKQRREHEEALRNLKRGDRVVTGGGIIAEVIHIKDSLVDGKPKPSMDDEVTIKSGESRLIIERGRIAKLTTTGTSAATTKGTVT